MTTKPNAKHNSTINEKRKEPVKKLKIINQLGLIRLVDQHNLIVADMVGVYLPNYKTNALHIVKCVNSHEKLVEALKDVLGCLIEDREDNEFGEINNAWGREIKLIQTSLKESEQ